MWEDARNDFETKAARIEEAFKKEIQDVLAFVKKEFPDATWDQYVWSNYGVDYIAFEVKRANEEGKVGILAGVMPFATLCDDNRNLSARGRWRLNVMADWLLHSEKGRCCYVGQDEIYNLLIRIPRDLNQAMNAVEETFLMHPNIVTIELGGMCGCWEWLVLNEADYRTALFSSGMRLGGRPVAVGQHDRPNCG